MHFFACTVLFVRQRNWCRCCWTSCALEQYTHNPCPFNGSLADWQTRAVPATFPKTISQALEFYVNAFSRFRCSRRRRWRFLRQHKSIKPYANAIHFEFLWNFISSILFYSSFLSSSLSHTLCWTVEHNNHFSCFFFFAGALSYNNLPERSMNIIDSGPNFIRSNQEDREHSAGVSNQGMNRIKFFHRTPNQSQSIPIVDKEIHDEFDCFDEIARYDLYTGEESLWTDWNFANWQNSRPTLIIAKSMLLPTLKCEVENIFLAEKENFFSPIFMP